MLRTYTLTTGADTVPGTANNDVINAGEAAGAAATLTVGDSITGGAGTDTLNITQTAAVTIPVGVTVSGVERINVLSATTATNVNTSSFTGVEALSVTAPGVVTARAAATTAITVTDATLADSQTVTINGGSTVTATTTAAVTAAAGAGTVTVGATAAAAGAVVVNTTSTLAEAQGLTTGTGTVVNVTGGTSVTVNNTLVTATGSDSAGDALTGGAVAVTGNVSTTAVSVTQTAARAAPTGVTIPPAIINGGVTITDVTEAAGTADRIATVTLANYGASTVTSSALSALNLTGGTVASGALTLDIQSATTPVTTLALNLNGGSFAAIGGTHAAAQTTLNVAGATAASTLADFTSAGVTALNVSGDKAVTFTSNAGLSALTSVTSTNSAGVTLGSAIGTGVTFTGGAGADTITLTTGFTKAITMGGGNDTVTYGGAAAVGKGSVVAGDGTDTIVMLGSEAASASGTIAFNSTFSGFEVLNLSALAADTINLAGINGVNSVSAGGATGAGVINGYTSGGTLTLTTNVGNDGANTPVDGTYTVGVLNAALSTSDVFNINLSKSTLLAAGQVTVANVETINITAADAATAGSAAVIHTATLVATSATTINVSGNNGLTLTNTGNTAVTTFNASGVVANGTSAVDTAANLKVTFLSAKTSGTTTITGGAGDDVLTGVGATDTISGGGGADAIVGGDGADVISGDAGNDAITGNAGRDVLTGGAGVDSFRYGLRAENASATAANVDRITDFVVGTDKIAIVVTGNGAASDVLLGVDYDATTLANNTMATLATAISSATTVASIEDVYVAMGVSLAALTGSGASGALTVAQVINFANGAAAGSYVVINDSTAGFQAANDLVINITGITGTLASTDFIFG